MGLQQNLRLAQSSLSPSKKFRYLLEYSFVRSFIFLLQVLPLSFARWFGGILGCLLYLLLPSRFKIAKKNLIASFPKISEKETQSIVRGCWKNLGRGLAEFAQMNQTSAPELLSRFDEDGLDLLRQSYAQGKGVLVVTAHYGIWEIGSKFWPSSGFQMAVVARRIKNPYVNDLITSIRCGSGSQVIVARDAVRESIRWLKKGGMLAILMDHRISEGGLKVPFFGRDAYTTSLPALLALRYKVPVHMAYCIMEGDKFKLQVTPAIDFSDLEPNEQGIYNATLRMNRGIEEWVKPRPELWLWIHDRWK